MSVEVRPPITRLPQSPVRSVIGTAPAKTVQANPQFPGIYRTLAASYGNLGQLTEAEAAREKLQELLPHLTIAQLRERLPNFRDPDDLAATSAAFGERGCPSE